MADDVSNLTTYSNLFKIKYDKKSYAVFNTHNPLWAKIGKQDGVFKGKNTYTIDAELGFDGAVGSYALPEASTRNDVNATLARTKQYARILIDREAMLASEGKEHAFEQLTKRKVRKAVESFMRNCERQLFALENGKIFEGDNATNVSGDGTSGSPYVVRALSSTWVEGFVEIGDKVNVGSETTTLQITAVDTSTLDVSLVGTSATLAAAAGGPSATAAKIYMQNSKDHDMQSILAVTKATGGSLYNVAVQKGWKSAQVNASSAGLSTDLINRLITQVEYQAGSSPDLIVTSYKQYRKLQDLLADKLRYMDVTNRDKLFRKPEFNFQGIQWNSRDGQIPIVTSRMCPDDHMLALTTDDITLYTSQKAKWFDEDGTVLLRSAWAQASTNSDSYEARYGFYGDIFAHPNSQGVLYGLA